VAVLFLVTTVVLFAHLQSIPAPTDAEHHEDLESSEVMNTPQQIASDGRPTQQVIAHNNITDVKTQSNSVEKVASAENIDKASLEDVHVFYYPWYANVETDGKWNHWDHHILPHWNPQTKEKFKHDVQYKPPDDIGANFYPLRGPYSSKDPKIIDEHMSELSGYVVVISWWGTTGADGEGSPTNALVPAILKSAEKYGTYIAIHLEPYEGRNAESVKRDIKYIYKNYGTSPALYRSRRHNNRIMLYIYDSYHTPANEWATVFDPTGQSSIRGTPYDVVALGLYLESKDKEFLLGSHFDGFYTYFAANGFTEGSSYANWAGISEWATSHNLIFSCSLGPGYDDTRIRPWNSGNKKSRQNGQYYETQWQAALNAKPSIISITSYNEWHEGTQIEASIPKTIEHTIFSETSYSYESFLPLAPDYYMTKTHEWAVKFVQSKSG